MRISILAGLIACLLLLLCGCNDERTAPPDVHGPILQAAPASGGVSAATEHSIADAANARAQLAEAKAAHDHAATAAAQAAVIATQAQLAEQRKAEINAELRRFYVLAVLAFVAAGILAYEGNYKLAAPVGIGALACAIGPTLIAGLLAHETAVSVVVILGAAGALAWHFRAKEKVALAALETAAKHVAASEHSWEATHHPVQAVERLLGAAVSKARAGLHALAVDLHLAKAASPTVGFPTPGAPNPSAVVLTANLGTKVP